MIEPVRDDAATAASPDVRLGSATNAVRPILAAERPLGAGVAQWLSLLAVAGAALFADQLTKQIIASTLAVDERVDIAGPFSIRRVENSGIAFGFFASRTTVVIAVTTVAVAWMLWFFARAARRHPVLPVALGLVLGGSLANLLDRIRLGRVTDFLDLEAWPAFNLADTFIVVGVAVLFGALVLADRPRRLHGSRDGDGSFRRR
jgi:signal peptidase II